MFAGLGYLARGVVQGGAELMVTLPMVRWTWQGGGSSAFTETLDEFRPADSHTVREMMQGRYLFASHLIDTEGTSPFAVDIDYVGWLEELHSFSWLRHFRDLTDSGTRFFARTLVLDWIGREGRLGRNVHTPRLCAQRVMNWLRHHALLMEGATPEQARSINRSLSGQVQGLAMRGKAARDPVDALFAAIGALGGALCSKDNDRQIRISLTRLVLLLGEQVDKDGLHLSRNGSVQLSLLVELVSIRRALSRHQLSLEEEIAPTIENMHRALDALTLGNGEPAYFHGCGNLQHDIIVAVQAESGARQRVSRLFSGYGLLAAGRSRVIADGGSVPPLQFARDATASALAAEFSHGTELVFGNCGPAPEELAEKAMLFRGGITHSGPTIDELPAADFVKRGVFKDALRPRGRLQPISLDTTDQVLVLRTEAYRAQFGVDLERRLTLLGEGKTLVGQDRILAEGKAKVSGTVVVRFHLAPGARIGRDDDKGLVRIRLGNGEVWSFLWEGAQMHEEDSVRHSAHLGFHRSQQIVLQAQAAAGHEIAWVFTLND